MNTMALRENLLEVGFRFGEPGLRFADDQEANNKLDLGYDVLEEHVDLRDEVINRMKIIIRRHGYNPDFVVGVPEGATGLAGRLAMCSSVEYQPYLRKDPDTKALSFATPADEEMLSHLQRGILIEDVLNRRSSTRRALELPGMSEKIVAVIGIFDRGIPEEQKYIDKPVHSLISQPIPAELPQIHQLWRYAS